MAQVFNPAATDPSLSTIPKATLGDIIAQGAPFIAQAIVDRAKRKDDEPFRDAALRKAEAEATSAEEAAKVATGTTAPTIQQAGAQAAAAETAAQRFALDFNLTKEAVSNTFFDENTQSFITESGRVNVLSERLNKGQPLPSSVSIRGPLLEQARAAGFQDDIGAFLEGQRSLQISGVATSKAGARAAEAGAATAELANFMSSQNLRVIDDDGSSRDMTPEEARSFAQDPFNPDLAVALPSELEQQVQNVMDLLGVDANEARGFLAMSQLLLPLEKMQLDNLQITAYISYLGALSAQATAAALRASMGKGLTNNEIRLFSEQISDRLNDAFSMFQGSQLKSLKGHRVDEQTGQPIIGFWNSLKKEFGGAGTPNELNRKIENPITQSDVQTLLTAGLTDDIASATDEGTIRRALQEMFTRNDPNIVATDLDGSIFTFPIEIGGVEAADPQEVSFDEMVKRLGVARTQMFEVQTLITTMQGVASARSQPFSTTAPALPKIIADETDGKEPSPLEDVLKNLAALDELLRQN